MERPVGYIDIDSGKDENFKRCMRTRTLINIYEHSLENNKIYLKLLRGEIGWDIYFHLLRENFNIYRQKIVEAYDKGFIDNDTCNKAESELTKNFKFYKGKWVNFNG